MRIKLIFVDLDGTLLNHEKRVSEKDKRALIDCLDQGIRVFITSGRPYAFCKNIANLIDSRIEIVAFNGAFIESQDGTEFTLINEIDELKVFLDELSVDVLYKSISTISSSRVFPNFNYQELGINTVNDYECVKREGILKVLGLIKTGSFDTVLSHLRHLETDYEFAIYENQGFEITAKGCHKGSAIESIQRKTGIRSNESMCFGDGSNDIPMFRQCHYSVAMNNAIKSLKEIAWMVGDDHNRSGVSQVINEIMRKKENL